MLISPLILGIAALWILVYGGGGGTSDIDDAALKRSYENLNSHLVPTSHPQHDVLTITLPSVYRDWVRSQYEFDEAYGTHRSAVVPAAEHAGNGDLSSQVQNISDWIQESRDHPENEQMTDALFAYSWGKDKEDQGVIVKFDDDKDN